MAESLDFTPVLREIEAKRLASEEKASRESKIQFQQNQQRLSEIGKELKKAGVNQKRELENERQNILDSRREASQNKTQISDQVQAIKDQKDAQTELAKKIEANGGKAEKNLEFLKRNNAIQREELKLARDQATSPSQRKEATKDLRKAQIEGLKLALDPVISPLTSFANIGKKVLGTSIGIPGLTVGRLALLASLPIIINFLRSESFKKVVDFLVDNGEEMVRTAVSAIMSIGKFLIFIGKTIKETLQFLGIIEKDVGDAKDAAEEAEKQVTDSNFGLAAGIVLLGGALSKLGGFLRQSATRLGFLTGASQVKVGGVAKQFGIKDDQIIRDKVGGKVFKVTEGGFLQEFDEASGEFKKGKIPKQDELLTRLAREGSLSPTTAQRVLSVGARGIKVASLLTGVFKKLPILGQIFAVGDILSVISSDKTTSEKVGELASIFAGIGGGALGAIVGGAAGSLFGPFGTFLGSGIGGLGGYFGTEMLARGLAQYAVGATVDAFPESFFGYNINDIFNKGTSTRPESVTVTELSQTTSGRSEIASQVSAARSEIDRLEMEKESLPVGSPRILSIQKEIESLQKDIREGEGILSESSIRDFFGDSMLTPISATVTTSSVNVSGDALIQNASLKADGMMGMGGSVAVVNAVTTNDNKSSSNFFGMNFVQNPNPPRMNGVDITNAVMT